MNHIFKGIRSIFYSQKELEKRGWELAPSEQRKWEYWTHNIIAAFFSLGLCGGSLSAFFYATAKTEANSNIADNLLVLCYIFGSMFLMGLIGLFTTKQ